MRESYLHFVVVLLCFSHLMFMNAVPITRTRSLMLDSQGFGISKNTRLVKIKEVKVAERTNGTMEVELNDYPGAGSNNRHTPTPKKGCVDC